MNIGRESETIEFKKTTSEKDAGIISIASILNKHKHGVLYFGVRDSGDICGMGIGKDTLRSLSKDIATHLRPMCHYEISEKVSDEGLSFIEVIFSGENVPYSAFGRFYERYADEDRLIDGLALERFFKSKQKDYSSWEKEDSGFGIDNVDESFLKYLIQRGNETKRMSYTYSDELSVLRKFGLVVPETGNLNNAGNVLLSKNGPILVKIATFATETKDTFIKLNHYYGNIYECIEEICSYILKNIDWVVEIGETIKRKEIPEIPKTAIREIVLNAFLHGCYDSNTSYEVDVFSNRVCIYSPGLFPTGYTPEDFASGKQPPIKHNPKITEVLFRTDEIESFGSGFERVFKSCKEANVEYEYEEIKTGFRFTFFRSLRHLNVRGMSETQKKVFKIIQRNVHSTTSEIAREIGKTDKTVYRSVKYLKENNYIRRIGDDFNGYWEVL